MTTYLATFYTAAAYAEHLIDAISPEQALQKCRQKARDKSGVPTSRTTAPFPLSTTSKFDPPI